MKILKRSGHLGGVKPSVILGDAFPGPCLQVRSEEFTAAAVFHTEVEIIFRLERVVERDDEGMVAGRKDLLLRQCSLDLVALDHLLLAQDCHPGLAETNGTAQRSDAMR